MDENYGHFSGEPKTEWIDGIAGNRYMLLLEEFWYKDPVEKLWIAPKDSIINGASIPRALWSIIGSPFTGYYRRASIVHDVACHDPEVPRADADKMFHYACLADGCSKVQAWILYAGVRIGAYVDFTKRARLDILEDESTIDLIESNIQETYSEIISELNESHDKLSFNMVDGIVKQQLMNKHSNLLLG